MAKGGAGLRAGHPIQMRRVAENFQRVSGRIADAASGRTVKLVCVTKYARDEWIPALLRAGATDLAENLLPRAAERFDELFAQGHRFTRHLVGAPQSRKVKLIPGHFDWLQALDRFKTAQKLNSYLADTGQSLNVLLQVNIASEPQKQGVLPGDAVEAFSRIEDQCQALELRGLMAIPPWPDAYDDFAAFERGSRGYFRQMRELFDTICKLYRGRTGVDTLSLGMSQDYTWAVEEGATMVRVGSALFEGCATEPGAETISPEG
ncbi:YggS family pyridoxal phosphate-dependent enzyme [bacterium]|nr:YggS family pyridoxal phosphate-dependent enzyme [bacterium]